MTNGGDAAEQVVRLSLEGFEVAAKLSGSAAKEVAMLLISVLKQEHKTKGKARLTNMIKSGKELKVFSIPQKDLKKFVQQAKGFLDLQARMDRYSSANALLIYSQLPEATRIKDFTGWGEDNVRVKKGAKSISILEPVEYTKNDGSTGISYKVKKMFDVSQTNGKKQPAPTLNRDPEEVVAVMIDTSPVNVEPIDEMPQPGMGAFYKNEDQTLYIQRGFGNADKLCQNVAQELAFAQLSMENDSYNRREMGFKAVCVGYMVCKKFGIDTKSFAVNRIPSDWKDMDAKAVRSELSQMRSALGEIHSRVSDELYRQKQERSKDRER